MQLGAQRAETVGNEFAKLRPLGGWYQICLRFPTSGRGDKSEHCLPQEACEPPGCPAPRSEERRMKRCAPWLLVATVMLQFDPPALVLYLDP